MPGGKKKKSTNKQQGDGGNGRMVRVQGPGGFRLDFPIPRLPQWIGTPNLRANLAIYPRVNLDIPIAPAAAIVASGALAGVINIDSSLITNFASRFASLFKEFAIVGCRFEIRVTGTSAAQGLLLAYIDENSNAAPTAAAVNYAHAEVPFVAYPGDDRGSLHVVEWMAKSYEDLTWDATSTTGLVAYLKLYCSVAATGTTSSTAANLSITGAISCCFRGYV